MCKVMDVTDSKSRTQAFHPTPLTTGCSACSVIDVLDSVQILRLSAMEVHIRLR